ncbi:DUF167 domain-containing protein [Candidatus Acetothermia bacterium]|nr:DUF167 domain-containing protein [Candidatus Acetothermia bacterium]MBI3644090.1 DUF167 domain-containing protein [Candidatus Acetothermia bacterium]
MEKYSSSERLSDRSREIFIVRGYDRHVSFLREVGKDLVLTIKVKPKSRQNQIIGLRGDLLLISVTAAPEKGKANKAVIDLLARELQLPKRAFEILLGEANSEKVMRISGISQDKMKQLLALE